MSGVFDPSQQQGDVDSKIVAALERVAQALRLQLWEAAQAHRLSPIQVQFVLFLLFHDPAHCRVSRLAQEFGLTEATVSDAVKSLEGKGLLTRQAWAQDGRVSLLRLTAKGRRLAQQLSGWADTLRDHLHSLPSGNKEIVLQFLLQLIAALQQAGVISVARVCLTCAFFEANVHPNPAAPHHCRLLNQPLAISALRVDCPDHQLLLIGSS
ncbi:MAG: MarR family winged helix-turn-helix transcriptional regulator [Abditibacteriales bacterium]|nr:MarR family winged helix-turn-helix transcriptional regulator [Abditibacteriales bacterium]MDW8366934.1 MarR family winged helix-turn-helix transcriptional regulator [Abditibacteriales bacterium]